MDNLDLSRFFFFFFFMALPLNPDMGHSIVQQKVEGFTFTIFFPRGAGNDCLNLNFRQNFP